MSRTSAFQLKSLTKQFPFLFRWRPSVPDPLFPWRHVAVDQCDDHLRAEDVQFNTCLKCSKPVKERRVRYAERTMPLVREDRVYSLQVARCTRELLEVRPRYDGATGNLVDIDDDDAVFLLDASGNLIGEVRQQRHVHHNEAHRDPENEDGECVGEAIARLGAQESCTMILRRRTGFIVRDHHSVGGYEATLHLPPKGWSIAGWCAEQQRRADTELSAVVAQVTGG